MDNEPNNSLADAEFLTFLSMTGGGSINSIIIGETLNSSGGDPADFFYFTHKSGLKQVDVDVGLLSFTDHLDEGGVIGETYKLRITPSTGAAGKAIDVEQVVGWDAYGTEYATLLQEFFAAQQVIMATWEGKDIAVSGAEASYIQSALIEMDKIFEADGVNVDTYALGQQLQATYNTSVLADLGPIREIVLRYATLLKKWETAILRDPTTGAVLNPGDIDTVWTTSGTSSAFSVTGTHSISNSTEVVERVLDVPSITISVKSEEGAKLPTPNDDKFTGTTGPDMWDMLGGDDTVDGGKGNDTLSGNVGDDSILGGDGNDVLDGGPGKDTIDGGAGNDIIRGGSENDKLIGGSGRDNIDAFAGNDTIDAGTDNDTVFAGSGNDAVKAGDGDDYVTGEAGKDTIDGGSGRDTIIGGAGKDSLTGGSGNDEYRYATASDSRGSSVDVITDFDKSGNDRINFADLFGATLNFRGEKDFTKAGQVHIEDIAGPDVLVQVNLDSNKYTVELEIRLAAVSVSTIKADDFIL